MFRWLSVPRKDRVAHVRDGQFVRLYGPGSHLVWTLFGKHEFVTYDATQLHGALTGDPLPADGPGWHSATVKDGFRHLIALRESRRVVLIPGRWHLWDLLEVTHEASVNTLLEPAPLADEDRLEPADSYREATASDVQAVVLLHDEVPLRTLARGRYRAFAGDPWDLRVVPLTPRALDVAHQDLLTKDQVPVRTKPLVIVRVVDALRFVATPEADAHAYSAVQLALREVLAARDLDALLGEREALTTDLAARAAAYLPEVGLAFDRVSVKDITLAADVKELLAKVLGARKEAEAQGIRRREEVAHTRQLLNTARLLQSNPVLMRLRELEAYAEIASKVDKLTLVAGPDALARLALGDATGEAAPPAGAAD